MREIGIVLSFLPLCVTLTMTWIVVPAMSLFCKRETADKAGDLRDAMMVITFAAFIPGIILIIIGEFVSRL